MNRRPYGKESLPVKNHQKPYGLPEFSTYFKDKDYEVTCPAQLRILPYGGEQRTYYHRAWPKGSRFWRVIDFQEEENFLMPTIEACLKLNLFSDGVRTGSMMLIKLAKEGVIHKNRWFVEEINRSEFFMLTERIVQLCWRFNQRGGDDESFYDIESNSDRN